MNDHSLSRSVWQIMQDADPEGVARHVSDNDEGALLFERSSRATIWSLEGDVSDEYHGPGWFVRTEYWFADDGEPGGGRWVLSDDHVLETTGEALAVLSAFVQVSA